MHCDSFSFQMIVLLYDIFTAVFIFSKEQNNYHMEFTGISRCNVESVDLATCDVWCIHDVHRWDSFFQTIKPNSF